MNENYNVMITGAGPVGLTTACLLKTLNKNLRVCVLEKRQDRRLHPGIKFRNHGLHIDSDSVNNIEDIVKQAFKNNAPQLDKQLGKELQSLFKTWRNGFVRTIAIEETLNDIAVKAGIKILRGPEYELKYEKDQTGTVTQDTLGSLLEENSKFSSSNELRKVMQGSPIMIGADGAHSVIRRKVMNDQLVDEKTYQYVVELKFDTKGEMKPRLKSAGSDNGFLNFEALNKDRVVENKPVTLHVFVDKETYDSLRIKDSAGKLKGVFGHSWTFEELEKLAKQNPKLKQMVSLFQSYLNEVKKRSGSCQNEKISTLPLSVYRSQESVKLYKGKYFFLVGDANSGMILERGFNKGLKEAVLCANSVNDYFLKKGLQAIQPSTEMPSEFTEYQNQVVKVFKQEKAWADFKDFWVKLAEWIVSIINKIFRRTSELSYTINPTPA